MADFGNSSSPFKMGASQMMARSEPGILASPLKKEKTWREAVSKDVVQNMRGGLHNVTLRQTVAPQHQRPSFGNVYAPSPAPGSTIQIVRKAILKNHEKEARRAASMELDDPDSMFRSSTPSEPQARVPTAGSNSVKFVNSADTYQPSTSIALSGEYVTETPRTTWRKQFWNKSTPWGVDRKTYGGGSHYVTTIKSGVRHYDNSSRWEHDPKLPKPPNSEDTIRQIVYKLEQHCNTTFALNRAFKIFDKDMSQTIDAGEMKAVLITFSIDLNEQEIDQLMDDFGARDRGDGAGKTIKYQDFVVAVDTVGQRHPLRIHSGRYFTDLKARYLEDTHGHRLCTPGARAPVGCSKGGCYFPNANGLPSRDGRKSSMW